MRNSTNDLNNQCRLAIIIALAFLLPDLATAQSWEFESPDYKKIRKAIRKKDSNLFYPRLMERFEGGDSTLTLMEKRHLYYGYRYQPEYSPYNVSDYADSLREVNRLPAHREIDLLNIIRFADSIRREQPFAINALNAQLYAYQSLEDQESFELSLQQLRVLFDALLSSGDGTSKETAFYVLYPSHEYELLNILGFGFGGEQSLIDNYDYLKLAGNEYGIEGMYFEISACLDALSDIMK